MVGGSYGGGIQMTTIGTGTKTCVLKPGADCRGVVHRWTVEHHGNLRGAKFTGAHLHGADFRGADLRGADFRGVKLRHADLRGANLRRARFDPLPQMGKRGNQVPEAVLTAQMDGTNLAGAILIGANLDGARARFANLTGANLTKATLTRADLWGANLTGAILTGVGYSNTTCPNGIVTNTGC